MIEMLIGTLGFSIFTFIMGYTLRSTQREEIFTFMDQYNRLEKDKKIKQMEDIIAQMTIELRKKNGDE